MQRNVSSLQKGNANVTEHYLILVVKDCSCAIGHKTADWVEGKKSWWQKEILFPYTISLTIGDLSAYSTDACARII